MAVELSGPRHFYQSEVRRRLRSPSQWRIGIERKSSRETRRAPDSPTIDGRLPKPMSRSISWTMRGPKTLDESRYPFVQGADHDRSRSIWGGLALVEAETPPEVPSRGPTTSSSVESVPVAERLFRSVLFRQASEHHCRRATTSRSHPRHAPAGTEYSMISSFSSGAGRSVLTGPRSSVHPG